MKAYETKVSRPFRMNIAKIVTSSPSIRQSLQVCHVNAMEYDGLWMNAFQTGSGAQRRSHGAAFSGPGYHDDADDGGAGLLYKRRGGPGDTVAMSGLGGPSSSHCN